MKVSEMILGCVNAASTFVKALVSNNKINMYSRNVALTAVIAATGGLLIEDVATLRGLSVHTVRRHLAVASTQTFTETGFHRTKTGQQEIFTKKEQVEMSDFVRDYYPFDLGINTAYWNAEIITYVVNIVFHKDAHSSTVKRILRRHCLSYHMPETRNLRRDEDFIKHWTEMIAPELIATDRSEGRLIFFADEAACRGEQSRMRTWARKGGRSTVAQGERVSVNIIGALGLGCQSTFLTTTGSIDALFVIGFLQHLLDENSGKTMAIYLDNASWHTAGVIKEFVDTNPRIVLRRLPKYAPELNPIELIWARLKNNSIRMHSYDGVSEFEKYIGKELLEISDAFLLHRGLLNASELQYICDGLTLVA